MTHRLTKRAALTAALCAVVGAIAGIAGSAAAPARHTAHAAANPGGLHGRPAFDMHGGPPVHADEVVDSTAARAGASAARVADLTPATAPATARADPEPAAPPAPTASSGRGAAAPGGPGRATAGPTAAAVRRPAAGPPELARSPDHSGRRPPFTLVESTKLTLWTRTRRPMWPAAWGRACRACSGQSHDSGWTPAVVRAVACA